MGNQSGTRPPRSGGLRTRYGGVLFSLALVGMMLAGAVAGAIVLGEPAAPTAAAGQSAESDQDEATAVDSCAVVDEPGRYELTADVEGAATDACIQIASDDVVLDGNGHAVSGADAESGVGLLVFNGSREGYPRDGPALGNVTVRDVEFTDWERGVQAGETLGSGPTVTLRNVSVTDNGDGVSLFGADESRLTDVAATDNERSGIVLWETSNLTADGVTASGNGASGVSFSDTALDSSFSNVTVTDNGGHGIQFSTVAVNNTVSNATVANNSGAGVSFTDSADNAVRNSTVVDNDGPGVLAHPADGDRVSDVRVGGNEIAYRNDAVGVRYGAVADGLRLDSDVVASFDENVSSFDDADGVPEPPGSARTAGPAADLGVSDDAAADARATVTFPYADEAVGDEGALHVLRYSDGEWTPVTATSVDTENRTVTATVGESGRFVPVYADRSDQVAGNASTFVVTATNDSAGNGDDDSADSEADEDGEDDGIAYGFVVDGEAVATNGTSAPTEDDEEFVEERADGTTVVLGTTGDDGGDTFLVTGEIVEFATQPRNATVSLELDGVNVTERVTDERGFDGRR